MRLALLVLLAGAASAQSPLDAVADALGGRDRIDALESLVIASRVDAPIGGRDRVLRSTMTLRLPDATRWDVRVAGRTRTVVLTSRAAFSVLEGEARPLSLEAELD
ncbi:hypothetical protein, partial [Rubrivirga sp.]|uniref:hypothetical protein n=1 Tax=Rubrivirga sp. TaxID=1885344 RepID=UPI003C795EBD